MRGVRLVAPGDAPADRTGRGEALSGAVTVLGTPEEERLAGRSGRGPGRTGQRDRPRLPTGAASP
ncbi:hypothetical protein [Streptomyces sp. KL2]|uniref:hypothetical protein n=1 Tax=Streptomyces sp. KL2 TaxID=3050126 RepID=UPI00397B37A6